SALAILRFNMAAFTFSRGYKLASGWDGWTVGEWLVTYSNGFVRRGLSGELMLAFSRLSGLPLNVAVFLVEFTLFASFCVLFARLIHTKRLTYWFVLLCFSPTFVLFT